jgi:ADP-ribosylation factor protein 6
MYWFFKHLLAREHAFLEMCLLKLGANSSKFQKLTEAKDSRVLMVGLKGAGKSSLLQRMKSRGEATVSTVGFDVEAVQCESMNITVWDIGSQSKKIRSLWRHHYDGVRGFVFVIDSCDDSCMDLAKSELDKILEGKNMHNIPVVILANKQDLYGAASADEVMQRLGLHRKKCMVQPTCAVDGSGITQGLDWLAAEMDSL